MHRNTPEPEPLAFYAPVRCVRDVPVVEVYGKIDIATIPELLRALETANSQVDGRVLAVVDLRRTNFIDAAGARTLVERARDLREVGGELRIVVPEGGPVAHVFELLELDRTLDLYHVLATPTSAEKN